MTKCFANDVPGGAWAEAVVQAAVADIAAVTSFSLIAPPEKAEWVLRMEINGAQTEIEIGPQDQTEEGLLRAVNSQITDAVT